MVFDHNKYFPGPEQRHLKDKAVGSDTGNYPHQQHSLEMKKYEAILSPNGKGHKARKALYGLLRT